MLLAFLFLAVVAFKDTSTCYLRGYVYNVAGEVSFEREDLCQIESEVAGERLILWSRRFWVGITAPKTRGYVAWWYRWGSSVAHVDGKEIKVEWGQGTRG